MIWVKLALMLLKVTTIVMTYVRERGLISKGQDMEIARQTTAILAQTEYAKDVRRKIAAMDDVAVDAALRDLEPR